MKITISAPMIYVKFQVMPVCENSIMNKIQDYTKVISCPVIYSHQNASEDLSKARLRDKLEQEYVEFYKVGIPSSKYKNIIKINLFLI